MSLRCGKNDAEGFLDLTTCSDIIFTLLLFYILTQNTLPTISLNLPALTQKPIEEHSDMANIVVNASGEVSLNGTPLGTRFQQELSKKLPRLASDASILIVSDRKAPAGISIEILDRLRGIGVRKVAFLGSSMNEE